MKRGFTLVELLIVIAILAILSTLGINNFQTARIKARDISRKSDLATIAKTLEAYVNDYRQYPSASNGKISCNGETNWGDPCVDAKGTIYAAKLPSDPGGYNYYYVKSGVTYTLYAHIENTEDPSLMATPIVGCGGAGNSCNYKITSSNQ